MGVKRNHRKRAKIQFVLSSKVLTLQQKKGSNALVTSLTCFVYNQSISVDSAYVSREVARETIRIHALFLSHFLGNIVPRFDWERPVVPSWKLAWVNVFGRRIRWKKNQVLEIGLSQVFIRSLPSSLCISRLLLLVLPHFISPVRPENRHGGRWSVEENSLRKSSKTMHFYYLISTFSFFQPYFYTKLSTFLS